MYWLRFEDREGKATRPGRQNPRLDSARGEAIRHLQRGDCDVVAIMDAKNGEVIEEVRCPR